jgi:hypothetical protein
VKGNRWRAKRPPGLESKGLTVFAMSRRAGREVAGDAAGFVMAKLKIVVSQRGGNQRVEWFRSSRPDASHRDCRWCCDQLSARRSYKVAARTGPGPVVNKSRRRPPGA